MNICVITLHANVYLLQTVSVLSSHCKMEHDEKRVAIATLLRAGSSIAEVKEVLNVSRVTIWKVKKLMIAEKDILTSKSSGRPRTARTARTVMKVKRRIKKDPNRSLRSIACEIGVSPRTVRRIVKEEGWRSLKKQKIPLLSKTTRQTRVVRARKLLTNLKGGVPNRIVFFSDEKNFTVDPSHNATTDRYIQQGGPDVNETVPPAQKYCSKIKHAASAMFFGVVASTGEVPPPDMV